MDAFEVQQHVMYRFGNAVLRPYPFPHIYVEDVFPPAFYTALRNSLPPTENYASISNTGRVWSESDGNLYGARRIIELAAPESSAFPSPLRPFWDSFLGWLMSDSFATFALDRFGRYVKARFAEVSHGTNLFLDLQVVRDFSSYSLGPHTDHPKKVVVLLFYLAGEGDREDLGTSLYVPREHGFTCEGLAHYDGADFVRATTAPYRPNSMLAFFKCAESFHGVEPLAGEGLCRNLLQLSITHRLAEAGQLAPVLSVAEIGH